jgi:protein-S-isoprenylcysteine O-methyltransferase Ste14
MKLIIVLNLILILTSVLVSVLVLVLISVAMFNVRIKFKNKALHNKYSEYYKIHNYVDTYSHIGI